MSECLHCGARERYQRNIMRFCEYQGCQDVFYVKTHRSKKRFCNRTCQLRALQQKRANQ